MRTPKEIFLALPIVKNTEGYLYYSHAPKTHPQFYQSLDRWPTSQAKFARNGLNIYKKIEVWRSEDILEGTSGL